MQKLTRSFFNPLRSAFISIITSALFLILLVALHFIEPELEPSRHLISEYELCSWGWLMSAAFLSWSAGLLTMLLATWSSIKTTGGIIGRWWLMIICIAIFVAAIFYPYTVPNTASKIHSACGMLTIFTFPIAATLYYRGLANSPFRKDSGKLIQIMTWIVWIGFFSFFLSLIYFHPVTEIDKANLPVGWENRFMVFTYNLWILVFSLRALRLYGRKSQKEASLLFSILSLVILSIS